MNKKIYVILGKYFIIVVLLYVFVFVIFLYFEINWEVIMIVFCFFYWDNFVKIYVFLGINFFYLLIRISFCVILW